MNSPAVVRIVAGDRQGSGFVIDPSGFILTSSDLVDVALTQVAVGLPGRGSLTATVVGRDETKDVAILRLNGVTDVASLMFVDPPFVPIDEPTAGIGYIGGAFGGGGTVVVQGRVLAQPEVSGVTYLQIDRSFNSGFAGGPISDLQGRVIGMVSLRTDAILGPTSRGTGLGVSVRSLLGGLDNLKLGAQIFEQKPYVPPPGVTPPPPPFPNLFHGTITIDGNLAPRGTRLQARIGGYVTLAIFVGEDGTYPYLTVQPPLERGYVDERIIFYVNGFLANQSTIYKVDQKNPLMNLDLTISLPTL